ncbi:MAG: phosphatidylglycerol lysyltransferase domain-containing protein [Clostridiales bacterium]|jgi:hypothetical protein|nr:phosphatidylglycerol lysyltransferase domain-containing protein [Clostridiales bacterium]
MLTFRPFELAHKPMIDTYFKAYPYNCSEFTFANVLMWGQDGKLTWAERDGALYVKLKFGMHAPFMFPPLIKDFDREYIRVVDVALRYFRQNGFMPRFRSVNGPYVELFQKNYPQLSLTLDRDNCDYVYLAEDLINLSGRKLHAKRNHIHQFTSQYAYEYIPLTPDLADDCMRLYLSWLEDKNVNEPGILGEMKAIQILLPNMDVLGVKGGCIFVRDKLVAFSLGEKIRDDLAVIHIEKADSSLPGLYAVINQQFAANEWADVIYINREEDMGIPGMRKAKLSYRPHMLVEKYDAIWRP